MLVPVAWPLVLAGLVTAFPLALLSRPRSQTPDLLLHPVRRTVARLVDAQPGATASDLCRRSGVHWGTMQHHLRLLETAGLLTSTSGGRDRGFFHPRIPRQFRPHIVGLRTGRTWEVAHRVLEAPGLSQRAILETVGMTRKVFRRCIESLLALGLAEERRDGSRRRYFPTQILERVSQHIQPSRVATP